MKVFNTIAIVSGLVAADNKKVPPRTPDQRLNTLTRFYKSFVSTRISQFRPSRGDNHKERIERMSDAMMAAYFKMRPDGSGLRSCSFFDPNVPNGGPRPNDNADDDTIGRKRRDTDAEDPFDVYEQNLQDGERSSSVRLSNDPAMALRQVFITKSYKIFNSILFKIRTGFQKWIYRYISECSGHRENGNHSQRLKRITDQTLGMMSSIKAYVYWNPSSIKWENDAYHHEGN